MFWFIKFDLMLLVNIYVNIFNFHFYNFLYIIEEDTNECIGQIRWNSEILKTHHSKEREIW
jgi:hypothetical protein